MVGWSYQLNGRAFEQTPGDSALIAMEWDLGCGIFQKRPRSFSDAVKTKNHLYV